MQIANGVWRWHWPEGDLNVGLVVGDHWSLVIDTSGDVAEGAAIAREARKLADTPLVVVNTHAHPDHVLGNVAFVGSPIWAHPRCISRLNTSHAEIWDWFAESLGQEFVDRTMPGTTLVVPTSPVAESISLDLGGRQAVIKHLGRGHTDGDLVVIAPQEGVVFAGDLTRSGGIPWIADSYPLEWAATLSRVESLGAEHVVPGHGDVVDNVHVAGQRELFEQIAEAVTTSFMSGASPESAMAALPLPPGRARDAVRRGYGQLSGELNPKLK